MLSNPSAESEAVDLLDQDRVAAQQRRVRELRAEAEYHQRRVDSNNAQADVIERTWGLKETPAEPEEPGSPAFDSYREFTPNIMPMPEGMP